jgi:hypothetical protein
MNLTSARFVLIATPPSSGFATFSPRQKRGGRRRSIGGFGEGLEFLNVRAADLAGLSHLARIPNRAPSPHRFSDGEKVAEGRMRGLTSAHFVRSGLAFDRLRMKCEFRSATPPSSGFATFSPRKKRRGRRRSMGGFGEGLDEGCAERFEFLNLNLAQTPNRAPSPHRLSDGEKVAEGRMRGRGALAIEVFKVPA